MATRDVCDVETVFLRYNHYYYYYLILLLLLLYIFFLSFSSFLNLFLPSYPRNRCSFSLSLYLFLSFSLSLPHPDVLVPPLFLSSYRIPWRRSKQQQHIETILPLYSRHRRLHRFPEEKRRCSSFGALSLAKQVAQGQDNTHVTTYVIMNNIFYRYTFYIYLFIFLPSFGIVLVRSILNDIVILASQAHEFRWIGIWGAEVYGREIVPLLRRTGWYQWRRYWRQTSTTFHQGIKVEWNTAGWCRDRHTSHV